MKDNKPPSDNEFSQLIGDVRRLSDDKVNLLDQTPKKPFVSPRRKNKTASSASYTEISDNFQFTAKDSYFSAGLQKPLQRKIRQGQLSFQDRLDLHGFNQQQALTELIDFFDYCANNQYRSVIIVHGKGTRSNGDAVIKPLVQHWLSEQSVVLAYCPARPQDGGSGASYVYLKSCY